MKHITLLFLSLFVALTIAADEWTLVTDTSDLKAGDRIILAYKASNVTASTTNSNNNSKTAYWLEPVATSFSGNTLTPAATTAIFTIGGTKDNWTLTNQNGQVLGVTAAKKIIWNNATDNAVTTWKISSGGIISSTVSNYGAIYYNTNPTRFTTYYNPTGNTIKQVQIYKGTPSNTFELTYAGFPYRRTSCEIPTYAAGSQITLPDARPIKDGQQLTAWRYEGQEYLPGSIFVMPEKDVELQPVWEASTATENTDATTKPLKVFRGGQLVIIKDDVMYNVLGERIQ